MLGLSHDMGIDLGTTSIKVYLRGKGIVAYEPSVVALDKGTGKVLAVGEEARRMVGRTPGDIEAVRPMRDGVIADYGVTMILLRHFVTSICGKRGIFRPRVIICVPSGITGVERRAVLDAAMEAGAGRTYLIEEPVAAAIGAGLDISEPSGNMVIDIGGGTAGVAVISLNGIVVSSSLRIGGDKCDEAIIRYIRKKYNLMIGEGTAEEIKVKIGSAHPREIAGNMEVRGRDLVNGLPHTIAFTSQEAFEALSEPVAAIVDMIKGVLERTPPELAADISDKGMVLTGGGSLLRGLPRLIGEEVGIPAYLAEDPTTCVVRGTGRVLEELDGSKGLMRETLVAGGRAM